MKTWDDPSKKPVQIQKGQQVQIAEPISDMELSLLARQIDDRLCDMEELENRERERRKAYKEKHISIWEEVKDLRRQVRTGERSVLRVCDILADWRTGRMKILKAGTDEVIEDRAMTAEEKQIAML